MIKAIKRLLKIPRCCSVCQSFALVMPIRDSSHPFLLVTFATST